MKSLRAIVSKGLILLPLAGLVSCGGGSSGGGGDSADNFGGAAFASIEASPTKVDTGDRVQVDISLSNIHESGIALKIKAPAALRYVIDSAEIRYDTTKRAIAPTVNATVDDDRFIVFYVNSSSFGSRGQGLIHLELEGVEADRQASIEIDPDVDDPTIDNAVEFDADTPLFSAEDTVLVEITD